MSSTRMDLRALREMGNASGVASSRPHPSPAFGALTAAPEAPWARPSGSDRPYKMEKMMARRSSKGEAPQETRAGEGSSRAPRAEGEAPWRVSPAQRGQQRGKEPTRPKSMWNMCALRTMQRMNNSQPSRWLICPKLQASPLWNPTGSLSLRRVGFRTTSPAP